MRGDTRARIRTEALRLFVERGVEVVSVRDIADAVGMNASNLYAHYRAKEALIGELFTEGYTEYGRLLAAATGTHFAERLGNMVRIICRLHDEDQQRFRFLLLTQHGGLAYLPSGIDYPIDVVQRDVARAIDNGEIPPGDPALLTAMIVGIVIQAATFRLYGRLTTDLLSVADTLVVACQTLSGCRRSADRT
jgi:AcrR family transcriptional regulator